jgi:diaminopimelate decarboxylase
LHQHKFGIPINEALRLYDEAARSKSLKVAGVSVHIGSQIRDVSTFAEAMERVTDLVRMLREQGHSIKYVDAGGGLGIDYDDRENACDPADRAAAYANSILEALRGLNIHLLLEPGRWIIGPAGTLITRVLYKKTNDGKKFLVVDAAMNDLLRPALYNAFHEIVPVDGSSDKIERVDVVGPVCESGDFLAHDRELPVVSEGDLLAILDAGAYGMVLASNYNSRPRPAEVLVDGKSVRLIRRRETVADLLRAEA